MNKANKSADTNAFQIFFDIGLCTGVFFLCLFGTTDPTSIAQNMRQNMVALCLFETLYILSNTAMQVYNRTTFYYPDRIFRYNTWAFILAAVFLLFLNDIAGDTVYRDEFILSFLAFSYIILTAGNQLFYIVGRNRTGKYTPHILLVGTEKSYKKYLYYLSKTNTRVKIIGYLTRVEMKGGTSAEQMEFFDHYLRVHAVDKVCFMEEEQETYTDAINLCIHMGITVELVINHAWVNESNCYASAVGTYPVVIYHTISLNAVEQLIKRMLDIVGSLVGILISSPVLLAAAIAIKLDSPGPVFFTQTRVGMNGRLFRMFKLRTMYIDAEERKQALMAENEMSDGRMFKLRNDPRITCVGRFLRRTSIDELPQLFNVLINDMSLVGTRPPTVDEVKQYERSHWRRISIKPGITGMWQISGRSQITDFEQVVQLDVSYIDGWSIFRDLKIIFQTVYCVLAKQGAF